MQLNTLLISFILAATSLLVEAHGGLQHEGCRPARRGAHGHAHPGHQHAAKRQLLGSSGEGQISSGSGGASAAGYNCDPSKCKLPKCNCASTSPPGGLDPKKTPMFITFTADDAVQVYTIETMKSFLGQRKNPNGCSPLMTYFTSLNYTNYGLVTEWYVAGNEIADHTMTHVGIPPVNEITGNLIALNALSGIPFKDIIGFRAPFLSYTNETLSTLHQQDFTYDSSASSAVPVTDPNTDAFWPYTLDNGLANDCTVDGIGDVCHGQPVLPGLWEIPMYAVFDKSSNNAPHLMDPWLDADNADDVLTWLKDTFTDHYNGNRQPFGLYSHPIHLATDYPGVTPLTAQINMINEFLDWATASDQFQNVWIISNKQLISWMQNPVTADKLNTLDAFQCQQPNVNAKICNGMPGNDDLQEHCISDTPGSPLNDSPFYTCYGCPNTTPVPDEPNPPQVNSDGTVRTRIPSNCATPWWDPIAAKCLCSGGSCSFTDQTRTIGPNGGNLTSSGGTNVNGNDTTSSEATSDPYTTFGGAGSGAAAMRLTSQLVPIAAALCVIVALA